MYYNDEATLTPRVLQNKGYKTLHDPPKEQDIEPNSICVQGDLLSESESSKKSQIYARELCLISLALLFSSVKTYFQVEKKLELTISTRIIKTQCYL